MTAMSAQTRLECVGVTVRFGGLVAVRDVSLSLPPATIVGLVGPNGAGKSTLFGVLSGLLRPTSGRVLLDDEDVTDTRPQVRAARGLARTFQHPELFVGMSIRDHLVIAHRAKHSKSRVLSDVFTMGSLRPAPKSETESVDELIELLGLTSIADRSAVGLPLGVARLVELGRALAASPRVLLLDEPSSGLDSAETQRFEAVLRRVVAERDISVLLVEHDVELVMRLCSTVHVLDFGALLASGPPEQVRANPAVRAAYLGQELAPEGKETDAGDAAAPADRPVLTHVEGRSAAERDRTSAGTSAGGFLAVDNLSVRYGDAIALNGVSFELNEGRALAVLGANGAGKSSLARAISGLVHVLRRSGELRWPLHHPQVAASHPPAGNRASARGARCVPRAFRRRQPAHGVRNAGRPPCPAPVGGSRARDLPGAGVAPGTDRWAAVGRGAANAVAGPRPRHFAEADHRRRDVAGPRSAGGGSRLRRARAGSSGRHHGDHDRAIRPSRTRFRG